MSWNNWIEFFVAGWGLLFTVYVIVQSIVAWFTTGRARILVLIPMPMMLLVLIFTFSAYQEASNLWPLLLILLSPIAIVYIIVIWFIQILRHRRRKAGKQ